MEKKSITLCDTDILIEFYRNNQTVIKNLKSIGQENIAISIVTVGEILFGAFNKRELAKLKYDSLVDDRKIQLQQKVSQYYEDYDNLSTTQKRIIEVQKSQVEHQKLLVEEHQKEIIDSITYARRIQRSLLPSEKYIEKTMLRLKKNE